MYLTLKIPQQVVFENKLIHQARQEVCQKLLEYPAPPSGRDIHQAAVFSDSASSEFKAVFLQFLDQLIIVEWLGLVFVIDYFLELGPDRVPTDAFAVSGFGTAAEEITQGIDADWGLEVFAGNGSRDSAHVNAQFGGYVNHRQGFEILRALIEKVSLVTQYVIDHTQQRGLPLFDGFDQPAGGPYTVLQIFFGIAVEFAVLEHFSIEVIDSK